MKSNILAMLFVAVAASCALANAADPVVVELFTSEGCSSCPPADAVLRELGERDDVIILAWHVDYWDRLGWADPFGDAAYSERQLAYAKSMKLRSRYTPQMIVNGETEFNGSDRARALREIARAEPFTTSVSLDSIAVTNDAVTIAATVRNARPETRVLIAITEDSLETADVPRGENRGKTLAHDGVVRYHATLDLSPDETQSQTFKLPLDPKWSRKNLKVVALVESQAGRGVSAATVEPMHHIDP